MSELVTEGRRVGREAPAAVTLSEVSDFDTIFVRVTGVPGTQLFLSGEHGR